MMLEIFAQAVADWLAAEALSERAFQKSRDSEAMRAAREGKGTADDEGREWDVWTDAANGFKNDARDRLAALVLMIHGLIDCPEDVKTLEAGWSPVAFSFGPCIYVVSPEDDDRFITRPRLTVVGPDGFDADTSGDPDW